VSLKGKPCPACGRKGLHYADHPHAYGHKDYGRIECRFCRASFKRAVRDARKGE